MYDTAKLFRPVLISLFLGLLLADVSLAQTQECKEYRVINSNRDWFPTREAACIDWAKQLVKAYPNSNYRFRNVDSMCNLLSFTSSISWYSISSRKCEDPNQCKFKKGQKFRDGTFTYELTGKGKGLQVAMAAAFDGKPVGTCDDGCAVSGSYSDLKQINPGQENEKSWISATNATYTGTSCSVTGDALGLPDTPSETPPDQPQPDPKDGIVPGWSSLPKPNEDGAPVCPKGRCPAQVNGMDICVDCDATMSSSSTSKKTESTTTPSKPGDSGSGNGSGRGDGNGSGSGSGDGKSTSSEESQSVTKCQGGVCETTTKTKSKDGKGTKETTTTTKQSQSDYCQKNPQDEANCALKFGEKKKGDGEGDDACKKDPKRIGCLSLGEPTKGENTTKNSQEVRYQEGNFTTGPASCPAPKTFQVFGQTYKLEFTKFCEMSKYLKPLVLLVASVITMFIVINGLKK